MRKIEDDLEDMSGKGYVGSRLQTEMIAKSGKTDKYSVVTKKNPINGDRNGIWHNKRSVNGKAKA